MFLLLVVQLLLLLSVEIIGLMLLLLLLHLQHLMLPVPRCVRWIQGRQGRMRLSTGGVRGGGGGGGGGLAAAVLAVHVICTAYRTAIWISVSIVCSTMTTHTSIMAVCTESWVLDPVPQGAPSLAPVPLPHAHQLLCLCSQLFCSPLGNLAVAQCLLFLRQQGWSGEVRKG